jgi:hypothetical protein
MSAPNSDSKNREFGAIVWFVVGCHQTLGTDF